MSVLLKNHPGTIILADDNQDFLASVDLILGDTHITESFTNPLHALERMNKHTDDNTTLERCLIHSNESQSADSYQIDVSKIHENIYNKNRFKEVLVTIFDYEFPEGQGIDFLREIINLKIQKILLTGKNDFSIAVDAFNNRAIQRYIHKHFKTQGQEIIQYVNELVVKYFSDETKHIRDFLGKNSFYDNLKILDDASMIALVNQLYEKHKIVEHYLWDWNGSLLMLDMNAKPMLLILQHANEIAKLSEEIRTLGISEDVIASLARGSTMLYSQDLKDGGKIEPESVKNNIYQSDRLGSTDMFYTVIDDVSKFGIKTDEIMSYNNFIEITDG